MSDSDVHGLSAAAETVLTFLASVGRRSEAEFYLRLFRQLPKESFALVIARHPALHSAPGSFVEQLRFLADLGLVAPIVLGAWSPEGADAAAAELADDLVRHGLDSVRYDLTKPDLAEALAQALKNRTIPLVCSRAKGAFECIGQLARRLQTRKLVVLRREGGLGPRGVPAIRVAPGHELPVHSGGISVINLRADRDALVASGQLTPQDTKLLACIRTLLEHTASTSTTLSVTSPLSLLNELFTVKGAGTLVKLGSSIQRLTSYAELDRPRLTGLLESSFKRKLKSAFFEATPEAIYLEEDYRGAALVQPGVRGGFLTKFAVDPVAQGEGIGQDLWRAMYRDIPSLYWRARPTNAILAWYKSVCDGFTYHGEWAVFWRGYAPQELAEVVADAIDRPLDFEG